MVKVSRSGIVRSGTRLLALAISLMLVATACRSGGSEGTPMTLTVLQGSAVLERGDERTSVGEGDEAGVEVGDLIDVNDGIAELRLARGRNFELDDARAEIVGSSELRLSRGNLLADLTAVARVDSEEVVAFAPKGAFRIDRSVATRVGVYSEDTLLSANGDSLEVPQFRQAVVAGGVLPGTPEPLLISSTDRWDRRFLQEALDLEARLVNFGRGLEAQLGSLAGITFFGQVLPESVNPDFVASFLQERRSDVLIGAMIAIASGELAELGARFQSIMGLWRQGASWGLIAFEYGASATNLFDLLLAAIARAGFQLIGGGLGPGLGPGGGQETEPQRPGSSPSPGPTSPGPGDPTPSPTPEPVGSIIEEAEGVVDEVECTLGGLLGTPCPSPSP